MTTHFRPANTAIQEVKPWELEAEPERLEVSNPDAAYAVIMVMAGDGNLGHQVFPDLSEMGHGVSGGNEISVLALVDFGSSLGTTILEVTGEGQRRLKESSSIDTGDPRPIASFLTMALNSYSDKTRIALGFWGHGSGVFHDLDPKENLLPDELLQMPLGTKLTETLFLQHYLSEPAPIKGFLSRGMLPDESTGGVLTNRELSSALTVAFSKTGREEPVDLLFFDTCQNGAVEVYAELRRYCKVFVASCLTIPGLGWNYTWFLQMTRRILPRNAEEWSVLAVEAYNKAYDQSLFPKPVQLVALRAESEMLEKFRGVADELKEISSEEYSRLMITSMVLHPIVHHESVDICELTWMLSRASGRESLVRAADEFVKAYQGTVVALSDPPNNGKPHSGLSLWCPRMGDVLSVGKYYQHLRFHKETGWFEAVRQLWTREKERKTTGLQFLTLQEPELLEEREVKVTTSEVSGYEGRVIAIRIREETKPWSGELKEGIYRFQGLEPLSFRTLDKAGEFFDLLRSVRRRNEEFAIFDLVCNHDMVMDAKAAKRLLYEFSKYEAILMDEFPSYIKVYSGLRNLVEKAVKDGILLIGPSNFE